MKAFKPGRNLNLNVLYYRQHCLNPEWRENNVYMIKWITPTNGYQAGTATTWMTLRKAGTVQKVFWSSFFSVECLGCHGWRWTTRTLGREDVTRLVSVFNELRHWRGTHLLIYIRPLPGGWNWVYCNMKAQMVPCFGQWQGDYSRNDFGTFRSLSCLSTPRCIPWSAEIIQSFSSRSSIGKDKEQTRPDSRDNWRDGFSMVKWTKRIPAWRISDPWHGPDLCH